MDGRMDGQTNRHCCLSQLWLGSSPLGLFFGKWAPARGTTRVAALSRPEAGVPVPTAHGPYSSHTAWTLYGDATQMALGDKEWRVIGQPSACQQVNVDQNVFQTHCGMPSLQRKEDLVKLGNLILLVISQSPKDNYCKILLPRVKIRLGEENGGCQGLRRGWELLSCWP